MMMLMPRFPSVFRAREMLPERERELDTQQDEALTPATEYGLQLGYDLGTGAATAWGLFMPSLVV